MIYSSVSYNSYSEFVPSFPLLGISIWMFLPPPWHVQNQIVFLLILTPPLELSPIFVDDA